MHRIHATIWFTLDLKYKWEEESIDIFIQCFKTNKQTWLITIPVSDKVRGEGLKGGDKSLSLLFLYFATIGCSVQSRITSLHERLALSRIKEELVHVWRGEMS